MNNTYKTQIKSAFSAIELDTLKGQLLCLKCLDDYFTKNSNILYVPIGVNNHEFNDGDATCFSLLCYDLEVEYKEDISDSDKERIAKELEDLLESMNNEPINEAMFGCNDFLESERLDLKWIRNAINKTTNAISKLEAQISKIN